MDFDSNNVQIMSISNKRAKEIRVVLVTIAACMYVIALFKSTTYSASTMACLNQPNGIFNGGAIFMTAVTILFFYGSFFTVFDFDQPMSILICILLCAIVIGLGVHYYFRCFEINKEISTNLDEGSAIQSLYSQYSRLMEGVKPISRCLTYHTGDYYKNRNTKCVAIEGCLTSGTASCDENKGAKLVDFYVASSHQSCVAPLSSGSGNYVSSEMLKTVLNAGARFVDFDIFAHISDDEVIPVVRSDLNNEESHNYILLDEIWETIDNYGFPDSHGDPLFVHLNLRTNNVEVADKIAESFTKSIGGQHLLDVRYSYKAKKSIAREPICKFFNKVILVVTGDTSHTLLDELVNLHTSHNARILTAEQARTPVNPRSFAFSNQNKFTIIRPEIYDTNTNPEDAWTHGCQAFMMNYWNLGTLMKNHCAFFKEASYVMKDFPLQENRRTATVKKQRKQKV